MAVVETIINLVRQLFPTGRAYGMNNDGGKLIDATATGQTQLYNDIVSTLDSILPDNANFTADDATDWEVRLGMIVSPDLGLETRKSAIIRKMNHPGSIPARQSADYLEDQLHLAGFDDGVYVHENINDWTIEQILSITADNQMGIHQMGIHQMGNVYSFHEGLNKFQMGNAQMGTHQMGGVYWEDCIINHIDELKDKYFQIMDNSRTFVICGSVFGEFGSVDEDRLAEFRQLVLKIKPVKSIAIVLINYI